MAWERKDLLGLRDLTVEELEMVLETAIPMKDIIYREIKKVPTLRGKSIINLFYEPSTRTRVSFELAGKYLGADTINISTSGSSVQKGESLLDTARTLEAMGADMIVIRHGASGAAQFLAGRLPSSVINAGDGSHEHPTQALLDLLTIKLKKKRLRHVKVAIVGDIKHSRVARSNIWALTKMGAEVRLAGPPALMPSEIETTGAKVYDRVEEALEGVEVINVLRIQVERQREGLLPSLREYARLYGLDARRLGLAAPDALVMHPGPLNRGVEITSEVADSLQSSINEQVTNGVAVRMAVLYLLSGGKMHGSSPLPSAHEG